ncbi:Os09g0305900 [Oryza sativa Japonica Group]|uniref:Putative zinc finger CCCH domain-containing protein 58 n=1 Tax=Oryza sativa subsp. japonica TaxID=39947 RepID=C3H58_ORYSJ|nr:putative zinc finger CCCH domain-containing protein 58 [Oryza sativa Japonica Group]Q69KP0.1 RecName: Full=Putative zinc finger CCCH domain-containing protein 58; Short=OsC3H58 [Oryza sativa Japonica Group]KAF2915556.1 hypothetical protein DAI22_09g043900 [Oryza sativa Japonica Group]BAD36500.1 CRT/DRE binding factor-like protein [Oryza sativa Japonica Group]BAT07350.1 Os09g0305900 [Oryza sativa Japonica Group]
MDSAAAERPSSYAVNFPPLLPAPAPAVAGAMGVANHKSVLCMKWREGRCHNGVACRYAHGEEDQRIVPEMRVGGGGTSMHARSSPPRDGASSGSTASIAMAACRIEEQRHGRGGESFILPRSRRKRQALGSGSARSTAPTPPRAHTTPPCSRSVAAPRASTSPLRPSPVPPPATLHSAADVQRSVARALEDFEQRESSSSVFPLAIDIVAEDAMTATSEPSATSDDDAITTTTSSSTTDADELDAAVAAPPK